MRGREGACGAAGPAPLAAPLAPPLTALPPPFFPAPLPSKVGSLIVARPPQSERCESPRPRRARAALRAPARLLLPLRLSPAFRPAARAGRFVLLPLDIAGPSDAAL